MSAQPENEIPEPAITVPNIVTPCHGVPIHVLTTYTGGYMGSDVPSEIVCSADGCFNSWEPDGASDKYNKMPAEPKGTPDD